MKKLAASAVLATAAALALAGCGSAPTTTSSTSASQSQSATTSSFLACMISDSGGFEDRSFNQSGWDGMKKAQDQLGVTIKSAESKDSTDYEPNLASMQANNCDLTFTVGFNLADATKAQATANPNSHYAIIDYTEDTLPSNLKPLVFKTSDAAFLAGYVSAAYSKTGVVGTFGGMQFPTVTIFMDGFVDGVAQYNKDFSKDVKVLGWDKETQTGSFTGDFENQSKGQATAQNMIENNADVIMPVAGPVGLGAAAAAKETGKAVIVGVDADWFETAPDYKDIVLTSVIKEIGASVYDTIKATQSGSFSATPYIGTLANSGVAIAPYHNFDSQISQEVKDKVTQLTKDIIAGTIKVTSPSDPK